MLIMLWVFARQEINDRLDICVSEEVDRAFQVHGDAEDQKNGMLRREQWDPPVVMHFLSS